MNDNTFIARYGAKSASVALTEKEKATIDRIINDKLRWSRKTPNGQIVYEFPINDIIKLAGVNLYSFSPGPYVGTFKFKRKELVFLPPKWLEGLTPSHAVYMLINSNLTTPKNVFIPELKGQQDFDFSGLGEPLYALFIEASLQALHRGVYKSYLRKEVVEAALKGRMLINKQIKLDYSGKPLIASAKDELYPDNRVGVLFYTAATLVQKATTNTATKGKAMHLKKIIKHYYPNITDGNHLTLTRLSSLSVHKRGSHLEWPLKLAKIIIAGKRVSPVGATEDTLCLLINLFDLFECYVASMLYRVDNNFSHQYPIPLLSHKSLTCNRRLVYPDIVYDNKKGDRAVVEVKLKHLKTNGPDTADVRQVYLYASLLNLKSAFLIYPYNDKEIRTSRYTVCTAKHKKVDIVCYQLPVTLPFEDIESNIERLSLMIYDEFGISKVKD